MTVPTGISLPRHQPLGGAPVPACPQLHTLQADTLHLCILLGCRSKKARRALSKKLSMQSLQLGSEIGQGASAIVFRGSCLGVEAAIKMVHCAGATAAVRHEAAAYQVCGDTVYQPRVVPSVLGGCALGVHGGFHDTMDSCLTRWLSSQPPSGGGP